MSDIITNDDAFQPTQQLAELVDKMIDDRLTVEERDQLENLLEADELAMAYCADRLHLHAAMEETMTPVRVEVTQKKHVVLEKKDGQASVSKAQSNVVRIDSPKHGKAVEFPPDVSGGKANAVQTALYVVGAVAAFCIFMFVWNRDTSDTPTPTAAPALAFRNPSFEAIEISDKNPPYIFTILDWQDYFQGTKEKVCQVQRFTQGQREAYDGKYAAYVEGGFLTQRLTYTDGSPCVAQKGMRLKISGWAMLENPGQKANLSLALRVVTSPYPAMQQVEPSVKEVTLTEPSWQAFEAVLELPIDSLVMTPSIVFGDAEVQEVDITGKNLAVSIDNRTKQGMFLDALTIEVIE